MVFDGDAPESPGQGKRDRAHDFDAHERRYKMNRNSSDVIEGKDFNDKDKQINRIRDHRADVSRSGGRRDEKHLKDQIDGERHIDRQRGRDERDQRTSNSDVRGDDRRDDADHRKRYADNDSTPNRIHDGHKKSGDGNIYAFKRDERDYWKKNADSNRRDTRNESSYRKSGANDHGYKDRREEQSDRHRRQTKGDDDYDIDRRYRGNRKREWYMIYLIFLV